MNNKIAFDSELRNSIKETVTILAKAVKSTLGPSGTNVGILSKSIQQPMITNDGATVVESLSGKFQNELQDYIYRIIKTVSQKTDQQIGDGSTTLITLMESIVLQGIKSVELGFSQVDIVEGINKATEDALKLIEDSKINLQDSPEMLRHVASISANNDTELGTLIADAFLRVGVDGQIEVKISAEKKDYFEITDGQKYNSGMESNMFVNTNKGEAHFKNCKILLYEGKLMSLEPLQLILSNVKKEDQSILIVADDFTEEVMADLTYNKINNGFKLCAIRSPGYGTAKEDSIDDIALLSNSKVISRRFGLKIEDIQEEHIGEVGDLKVTSSSFQIANKNAPKKDIEAVIKNLKVQLKKETNRNLISEMEARIARLSNGIAELYIWGDSVLEIQEKTYRIEDAINATRASLEQGIVAGGGVTLFNLANTLKTPNLENEGQRQGYKLLIESLKAPIETICNNSGVKPDLILHGIVKNNLKNHGYDAKRKKYGDMIEMGIIDPVKVTKGALLGASSLSRMIISMNCVIY